ncbi:hypothetical protein IFM89_019538 [Coptis chinensis]|uniref:Uncharacterized protein n=1 Tax=Coptis chinensis TaxID=261450 RepID=A0A835LM42_9MAGN|nr:hypothetical protein IFM89_019538 [Coptis chinensis]
MCVKVDIIYLDPNTPWPNGKQCWFPATRSWNQVIGGERVDTVFNMGKLQTCTPEMVLEKEIKEEELEEGESQQLTTPADASHSNQLKELDGDANGRPSKPPDGEEEFADDDGSIFFSII